MLRLLADENFNGIIVSGLLKRQPDLDIVRVQDVGLLGAEDPVILEWAAREDRVLLTHDGKLSPSTLMNGYSPANGCRGYLNSCARFPLAERLMRYF